MNSSEILEERLEFDAHEKPFSRSEVMAALGQTAGKSQGEIWGCLSCWVGESLAINDGQICPWPYPGSGLRALWLLQALWPLQPLPRTGFCACVTAFRDLRQVNVSISYIFLPSHLSKWKIALSGTELFQMKVPARGKLLCTSILQGISQHTNPKASGSMKRTLEDSHIIKISSTSPQHFCGILCSVTPVWGGCFYSTCVA